MDLGIKGKKALVTGAGRGIGRAIAKALAGEGALVTAVSRTEDDLNKLLDEIGGQSVGHRTIAMDLLPPGAPTKLLKELQESGFYPLDIVVHNLGGTFDIRDPFCPLDDWRKLYRLNFEIAVEFNLTILPEMQKRKWGRIVHISSISALENQGPVPYCTVKAALTAYVRSMGGVVAPDGVVMSAVLPGGVYTEGGDWERMVKNRPEHVEKFLKERQRIGRFGRPEEIGNYVAFLCSELASFNTGSIVPVDGGQGRGYFGQ